MFVKSRFGGIFLCCKCVCECGCFLVGVVWDCCIQRGQGVYDNRLAVKVGMVPRGILSGNIVETVYVALKNNKDALRRLYMYVYFT